MRSIHQAALTAAGLIGAAACGMSGATTSASASGAGGGGGGTAASSTAASTTAASSTGGSTGECPGQCVPLEPAGWFTPEIVWFGDPGSEPDCGGDSIAYEGFAGLTAPFDCGTCACSAPTGSCDLPSTISATAAACGQTGATTTFDPASGWSGACDSNDAIPSGKLCGGVKCVQSVTMGPMTLNDGACTPSPAQFPPPSPPTWKTAAIACGINPFFTCPDPYARCAPAARPGFKVCVFADSLGDVPCATVGPYTERHVFYGDFDDTRACSPCTCGAPSGSACSSTVSLYTDGACSSQVGSLTVDATGPKCVDVPSGSALGSKSATPPSYTPGACAPGGGAPTGAATPTKAATYCCLPGP
jgi:hypothetical protein